MCHGKYDSKKDIRFVPSKSKHANAKPYERPKNKNFRDYED